MLRVTKYYGGNDPGNEIFTNNVGQIIIFGGKYRTNNIFKIRVAKIEFRIFFFTTNNYSIKYSVQNIFSFVPVTAIQWLYFNELHNTVVNLFLEYK